MLATSIAFIYIYSIQLIFVKCNQKWWYALIPFYNLFVLCDIVFRKKWLGIILLIPVIGQIFLLVILYKMAMKFKYSGLLAILFPIIFVPLMGFGTRLYEGVSYISEDRTLEKDYKRKKVFFVTLMILLVLSGILCLILIPLAYPILLLCAVPDANRILPGTIRELILSIAEQSGIPTAYRLVLPARLNGREVWAVNALHGIRSAIPWQNSPFIPKNDAKAEKRLKEWRHAIEAYASPITA